MSRPAAASVEVLECTQFGEAADSDLFLHVLGPHGAAAAAADAPSPHVHGLLQRWLFQLSYKHSGANTVSKQRGHFYCGRGALVPPGSYLYS